MAPRAKKTEPVDVDEVAVIADPGEDTGTQDEQPQSGMTTESGAALKTAEVEFRGRTIVVRVPDETQMAMMKRFTDRADAMTRRGEEKISAQEMITISARAVSAVLAVVANQEDRDWIEDGLFSPPEERDFGLEDLLPVIRAALDKLREVNEEPTNRAGRRAGGKSKSRLVTR
jgi:hypothetical protein